MAKVKIKGSRKQLQNSEIQRQIYQVLLAQKGRIRHIDIEGIQGTVELKEDELINPVMDLIKAKSKKKRGGELDLIKDLKALMLETFNKRLDRMNKEILRSLKKDR
tara:strand:- start:19 stop:336 length:318 start_codon:yes stop_codon:yes gene_type:complete